MSGSYIPLPSPHNSSLYDFHLHTPTPPPKQPPGLDFERSSPPSQSEDQEILVPEKYMNPDALMSPPARTRTASRPKGPKPPSNQLRKTSLLTASPTTMSPLHATFAATDDDTSWQNASRPGQGGKTVGTEEISLGSRQLPAGAGQPEPQRAISVSSAEAKSSTYDAYTQAYSNPFSPLPTPNPAKVVFSTASTPRSSTYGSHQKDLSMNTSVSDPLLRKTTFQNSPMSTIGDLERDFAHPFTSPLHDTFSSSRLDDNEHGYGFRGVDDTKGDYEFYRPSNNRMSTYSAHTVRNHPFGNRFSGFEAPQWRDFGIHFALCAVSYPILLIFVIGAKGKTLFWARVLVGAGCGLTGVVLGLSLLKLSRPIIEAATWATLIHQSRVQDSAGIRLKDFAVHTDDPAGALGALKLMWDRHRYPGAARSQRKYYDRRPWTIWILLFLANVALAGGLTFIFGRLINIDVHIIQQYKNYREVTVKGELTPDDLARATELNKAFENYALTWTIAPFSVHGGLPPIVAFPWQTKAHSNSDSQRRSFSPRAHPGAAVPDAAPGFDMVYFSEVITNQLIPGGSGFGTFDPTTTATNISSALSGIGSWATEDLASGPVTELEPGATLRFPRWGIRIKCEKTPDIIPRSETGKTYVFTPRDTLRNLFEHFDTPFPPILENPINTTKLIAGDTNDTLPSADSLQPFAVGGKFYDNGVAHSMMSVPISMGQNETGSIITIETILIRLNTTYAENGKFVIRSNESVPDAKGKPSYIGYDAAVCLQLYEPWVVQLYNSSVGVPNSFKLCDKGNEVGDMEWSPSPEVMKGKPVRDEPGLWRALNSSHLREAYIAGHQNSVNQILKDNGRDSYYVPNPTLVSYTDGEGAYGYTELSTTYYAKARALADASNVLPYFSGSGSTVARLFPDKEVSIASINNPLYVAVILVVLMMGAISTFFIPRLPLGSPRRGFDLYTWMTAFAAKEIVPDRASGLEKQMELNDIVQHAGELRFRYVG